MPVKAQVICLGYLLTHGNSKEHVERRIDKAAKLYGVATNMSGKTGGPPVSAVATVREATAETGILYGAEFTGGTDTTLLVIANARQMEVAKEIIGLHLQQAMWALFLNLDGQISKPKQRNDV